MKELKELIAAASAAAGNDAKLAKMIGVAAPTIANWKAGDRPCPVADVALMAAVAGLDPEAWALRAVVARHEGTPKGDMLMRTLKKASVAIGAGIATCGASAAPIYSMSSIAAGAIDWVMVASTTMYIMFI